MMGRDLARALDPVQLALDCGLTMDPWQARLLQERPRRALLLCSRQSGKTTVTALLALWQALYEPGSLIVIVSPSQRQSQEMFRSLMRFYAELGSNVPGVNSETLLRAEFTNGSRILALPGSERTVRGLANVALVIIDEASRVEDALLQAVRPMLATSEGGGRLLALTTPFGKRGWFFEAWETGGESWDRTRVSAADCPRISQEFLDEELRQLGGQRYSEEYELAFLENDEGVFSTELIDAAFSNEVLPLWN